MSRNWNSNRKYPEPEWFEANGYLRPVKLDDGRWQVIAPMLFTTAILIVQDEYSPYCRWCFENGFEAHSIHDFWRFDGEHDPPGLWVKRKGPDGDYVNPAWARRDLIRRELGEDLKVANDP